MTARDALILKYLDDLTSWPPTIRHAYFSSYRYEIGKALTNRSP